MKKYSVWSPKSRHWSLDPAITFLNHGSFGACPTPILEVQRSVRSQMERSPVAFMLRELPELWEEARARVAEFVGADAEGLVFVDNATTGVNAALRAIELSEGDVILALDHGYNACLNAADEVAQRHGAEVRRLSLPLDDPDSGALLAQLESALGPNVKALLIDQITSPSALVLPVKEICRRMSSAGVAVIVDGAHCPGQVPLELAAMGCDFFTGNLHKWVYAPKGAAILWVGPAWRERTLPTTVSHGYNDQTSPAPRLHKLFDWTGTKDPSAVIAAAALEVMPNLYEGSWLELMADNHVKVTRWAADLCDGVPGIEPIGRAERWGAMVTFRLPPLEVPHSDSCVHPLQEWLWRFHRIEVPVFKGIHEEATWLRISAQIYLGDDAHRPLIDALRELLPA